MHLEQTCWNFYKIAFSDLQLWLGPWVGFFLFLLILVLSFNIWLSAKWQIQIPVTTAGNHQTFYRNSNRSGYVLHNMFRVWSSWFFFQFCKMHVFWSVLLCRIQNTIQINHGWLLLFSDLEKLLFHFILLL